MSENPKNIKNALVDLVDEFKRRFDSDDSPGYKKWDVARLLVEVKIAELERENAQLRNDAERYRWLRDDTHPENMRKLFNGCPFVGTDCVLANVDIGRKSAG